MNQILTAFRLLGEAMGDARRRPLAPWVIVPTLFNLLLFGALYYLAGTWISGWMAGLAAGAELQGMWSFLNGAISGALWLLQILLWVMLLALFASVFTVAVQLVAAPFMGLLAEQVDKAEAATPLPDERLTAMVLRTFRRELVKTWDWLWRSALVALAVLIVWLIPPLTPFASAVWFLWSGWLIGIQYVDYGADTRQVPFKTLKQQARSQRWLVLTFGTLVLALTMVPLVNLVVMPVAVIAGTRIWHRHLTSPASS